MINNFVTVEDVNSVLKEFGGNSVYHLVDTSRIMGDVDFSGVVYDFVRVSRESVNDAYCFTVEVVNSVWTGGYWICDVDDNYIDDAGVSFSDGTLSITVDVPFIKLYLYLCNACNEFKLEQLNYILLSGSSMGIQANTRSTLTNPFLQFQLLNGDMPATLTITDNNEQTGTVTVRHVEDDRYESYHVYNWASDGEMLLSDDGDNCLYFENTIVTIELHLRVVNPYLVKGKVYTVSLALDKASYDIQSGKCYFGDSVIPFSVASDGGVTFDLDLRGNYHDRISFKVLFEINGVFHGLVYDCSVVCRYPQVSTVEELISECGVDGSTVVELNSDLTLTDDLTVSHDFILYGDSHTIDCDGYSIIVSDAVTVYDTSFVNGDTCFIQQNGSNLSLTGCSFTNCISTDYNNLGACVFCDIDTDSLVVSDDFITTLVGCSFVDNQSCILHGGELSVRDCTYTNNDLVFVDKHNSGFLYQTDGYASIRGSVFDINYLDDDLCGDEESIGFAQCLFKLGETATLNGVKGSVLANDDSDLSFFESPYNNRAHVFAKYYYPPVSACVFTSPVIGKEDKALCYSVSSIDYVFKKNVQVTRAEWGSENTIQMRR